MTRFILIGIVFSVGLSGCFDSGSTSETTQAAAHVNGREISIHQLNEHLRSVGMRISSLDDAQRKALGQRALDQLIDQELLVQQALSLDLERDPHVMRAIESAKRSILANAYIEKLGLSKGTVSVKQISEFYSQHPELFSHRKLFNYREIQLLHSAPDNVNIKQAIAEANSIDEFEQWLISVQIPFDARNVSLAAEQLPLERLNVIGAIVPGEVGFFDTSEGVLIVFMEKVIEQPMDLEMATPAIQQYLNLQSSKVVQDNELMRLREIAEIKYLGEFAGYSSQPTKE